jgi:hypothetical protein
MFGMEDSMSGPFMTLANDTYRTRNEATFHFEYVDQPLISTFWELTGSLQREIRMEGNFESDNQDILYPIYGLRGRLLDLPYDYASPEMGIGDLVAELKGALVGRSDSDRIHVLVSRIIAVVTELLEQVNPIRNALIAASGNADAILIRDTRHTVQMSSFLSANGAGNIPVRSILHISSMPPLRHIVYLGSPSRLAARYKGPVDTRYLLDPKAIRNTFILFPFVNPPQVSGLLPDSGLKSAIASIQRLTLVRGADEDQGMTDWELAGTRARRETAEGEIVERAKFIGLSGNHFMWAAASPGSHCRVVTVSPTGGLDLERVDISDLRTNHFIVERTSSSSASMIDQLADSLGAKRLRPTQERFKELLNERIVELGSYAKFETEIASLVDVLPGSLRRWVEDPRSIAPQRESDFVKVMQHLGRGAEAPRMWKELMKIRQFHLKAGTEILNRLRAALLTAEVASQLESQGFSLVSVPECGTLGAFRVEHVGSEIVDVPLGVVDVILKDGES